MRCSAFKRVTGAYTQLYPYLTHYIQTSRRGKDVIRGGYETINPEFLKMLWCDIPGGCLFSDLNFKNYPQIRFFRHQCAKGVTFPLGGI